MMESNEDTEGSLSYQNYQFGQNAEEFLNNRKALLQLWETRPYHVTSFERVGSVLNIPEKDMVRRGNPPSFEPTLRQRNLTGDIIVNLRQLYECAAEIKPKFDSILREIADSCKMMCSEWNGRDELQAQPGVLFCALKAPERATDKIREDYQKREPGPPEAWLYDIVRAGVYCETEEQIVQFMKQLQSHSGFEIIRIKNRFLKPTPSGFRDILLNVRVSLKSPVEPSRNILFVCEICLTLVEMRRFEVESGTTYLLEYFRPLFSGPVEDIDRKVDALEKACAYFLSPGADISNVTSAEQVNKVIADLVGDPRDSDDLSHLALWTSVFKTMGELELAAAVQRRLLKLQVPKYGEDHLDVADSLDNLGHLIRLQGKFPTSFQLYEKSVHVRTRICGDKHPLVAQSLHNMASVMYQQGKYVMATPIHELVLTIRRKLFGEEHPDVAASLANLAGEYFSPLYPYSELIF